MGDRERVSEIKEDALTELQSMGCGVMKCTMRGGYFVVSCLTS